MSSLRIQGLCRQLGNQPVLRGVDLHIPEGKLTCLLGPSGSGKTTLLKILAGQLEPDSGKVLLNEKALSFLPIAQRGIAFLQQNDLLFPHLTVAENAAFGLKGLTPEEVSRRVKEALQSVGAEAWAAKRPSELSGGQQQRVALARVLALRPQILLLDEPLSHLDAASRLEVRTTLRNLVRTTGLTVLCVLHDQKDALAMADHLALMQAGRIAQSGLPMDVYRRPVNGWVATFLGAANLLPGKILEIAAGEFVASTALGPVHGALATAEQNFKVGQALTICLRPECLRLDTMAPDENAFAGRVVDTLFQGEIALHDFQTTSGPVLRLIEANPRMRIGSKMAHFAWVEPEDVVGFATDATVN